MMRRLLPFSNVYWCGSGCFFFQAEDGIRDVAVTGVQTCALPISLEPDARAHRVDRIVARRDGDLGAAARLPRGGADLDDLLLDLRHLELEQGLDEQRVGTRQNEPRTLGRLLDPLQHGADRVPLVKVLAVVLLAVRNDRFGFTELREHDDDLATLDLLYFAREELADLVGELFPDAGPLALADALDDALLRGLYRRAAEGLERHVIFQT